MPDDSLPPSDEMVQCDITGQWVPESETIVFHGKRVSAAGKAELLDRLKAGERFDGELETASILQRFVGSLIDVIILMVPLCAGVAVFAAASLAQGQPVISEVIQQLVIAVIMVVYFGLMHGTTGQTIGKRVMGTKVVAPDGGPISMRTAFIRALFYAGVNFLYVVVLPFSGNDTVGMILGQLVGILVSIYGLANVIVALVDSTQYRAIHDRLSGTRVISIR